MENYPSATDIPETTASLEASNEATPTAVDAGTDEAVQAAAGQGTTIDTWDGKPYALKFRGKDIVPESKDKLLNWAQLGYTYSGKLNDIQTREQTLAERAKAVEQVENLSKAFESNPKFKQQILDLYYKSQYGQGQEQSSVDQGQNSQQQPQVPPEIVEKLNGLEQWKDTYEKQRANDDLRKDISSLQGKYAQFDWKTPTEEGKTLIDEVLKAAFDMGGVSLETAFRHVAWDQMQEMSKADALKAQQAAREEQAKKGRAVPPQPATLAKPKAQTDIHAMSYDEIARSAVAELNK